MVYSPTDVLFLFWFSPYCTSPQPLRNLTFNLTLTYTFVVMVLLTLAVRRNDVAVLRALPQLCWCCRDAFVPRMHVESVAFNTRRRKTPFRCLELDAQPRLQITDGPKGNIDSRFTEQRGTIAALGPHVATPTKLFEVAFCESLAEGPKAILAQRICRATGGRAGGHTGGHAGGHAGGYAGGHPGGHGGGHAGGHAGGHGRPRGRPQSWGCQAFCRPPKTK